MLRSLFLLAALTPTTVAQETQCTLSVSILIRPCDTSISGYEESPAGTQTPSKWSCAVGGLSVGEVMPMRLIMKNDAEASLGSTFPKISVSIPKDATITVYFACYDTDCDVEAPNVLEYADQYTAIEESTLDPVAPDSRVVITINDAIALAKADDPDSSTYTKSLGIVYTRVTGSPDPAGPFKDGQEYPGFFIVTMGSSSSVKATDPICDANSGGKAEGSTTATFLVNPPPPPSPPPPPNCCTKDNRNCLARCEQCVGQVKVDTDRMGDSCTGHCEENCPTYPTDDTDKCFERCLGCSTGDTNDKEGELCLNPDPSQWSCDNDCTDYYQCIQAKTCALGCVEGRRERKLLFAAIPPCVPCCKPLM